MRWVSRTSSGLGAGIAGRVVVPDDHGGGIGEQGDLEDLARMQERAVSTVPRDSS